MHSPALLEMILVYGMACDELDSDSYIQLDSIEEMNQIVMFPPPPSPPSKNTSQIAIS